MLTSSSTLSSRLWRLNKVLDHTPINQIVLFLDRRTAPISNAIIPKEQQLLTYQDAISQLSNGEKASLLIANGFSQAWDAQIFNYANILDAASFGDRDKKIKKLFSLSNTYDFESIMNQLVSAQIVLENYGGDPNLIQEIKDDQEILKEALVKAIAKTHPSIPNKITDTQFVAVRKFLSTFGNIFSLNYDLLLYWAINKFDIDPPGYRVDDGFRYPNLDKPEPKRF